MLRGWSGPCKNGEFSKWKPDLAIIAATINFATASGRLDNKTRAHHEEQEGNLSDRRGESEEIENE